MNAFWKNPGAYWDSPVTPESLAVFNIVGEVDADDDAASILHSSYNRAGPVFLTAEGRTLKNRRTYGSPTVLTDALEFSPGDAIMNDTIVGDEFCFYVLCATADTGIGDTANDRAPICGSFENAASDGFILYANTPTVWRAFTYDGGETPRTVDMTVDSTAKYRWLYVHVKDVGAGSYEIRIVNLTDGTTDGSATTFTGVTLGTKRSYLGYPYSQYTKTGRASIFALFDGVTHDSTQRASVIAALRAIADERSIAEEDVAS